MKKNFLYLVLLLFAACNSNKQEEYPFRNASLSVEERIEDLLKRMTPEEKVSQMMHETPGIERLGIPPYDWWNEALHGVARAGRATVFPQAIALAATFDDQAVYETFDIVSDEARAKYHNYQENKDYGRYKGLTFWTPNINIFRDPRWGRGMETYGEDPFLTGKMGTAVVKGLQGDDPKYFKSLACAKHFAVHSGPEWNRHEFDISVSDRDLRETYLPAFEDLVKKGNVQEIMCAYNRWDGAPCCGNNRLLQQILRGEWDYQGIVLSDCGAIDDFWVKDSKTPRHESHPDKISASLDAVRNGTDLECGQSYKSILEALNTGKISEEEVNVSLRRLLRGRFELGMFDNDNLVKWSKIPYSVLDSEKHQQKALEMAQKSMVLLKNKNNTLPLTKEIKRIAVVGPNADDSIMLWSNYNGFPSHTTTILQGLRNKFAKTDIIYEKGCDLVKDYVIEEFSNIVTSNGEVGFNAVYYGNTKMEGEAIAKGKTNAINYSTGGNTQYAQNVPLTNFSAVFSGEFKAPETTEVTYSLTGDDGYRLYLDNKLVIDNWGEHSASTKTYAQEVKKGEVHQLKIEYFQAEGEGQLNFSIGRKKQTDFIHTLQNIKDADVIVFVGGISPSLEGEEMPVDAPGFRKGDRTDIELPLVQQRMLKELKKLNKPVVFVLCTGSCIALNRVDDNVDAILNAWYGGQAGGTAVADILAGDYNPGGKLPITFYKSIDQLADFTDYSMKGRTYRYITQSPIYPFGYGLSYTNFLYKDVNLSKNEMKKGETVDLTVNLQNAGKVDGDEVVQVYIKKNSDKDGPIKSLRAFKRVNLKAGVSSTIQISLPSESFASYSEESKHMGIFPGEYTIWVGSSSMDKDLNKLSFTITDSKN